MKSRTPPRPKGTWVVDGHNVIYKVPQLTSLQNGGKKQEARSGLVERCRGFARHYDLKIVVVFDGTHSAPSRETVTGKNLQVLFSSGASNADDRIITLVKRLTGESKLVTVVTDDRGLKDKLPRKIATLGATPFWGRLSVREDTEEKESFSAPDIEAHFMAKESETLEQLRSQDQGQKRRRRKPR